MLYHLFEYLNQHYDIPGGRLFEFLSFRAAGAIIVSLMISLVFGGKLVSYLRKKQIGESIRDLGLEGQLSKKGTPTMGGLIILAAIITPTLLFADLTNVYVQLLLAVTILLGIIGFIDDYIKVFKKDKRGLAGKFKILGQVLVGLLVSAVLFFHPDVKVRDYTTVYYYQVENGKPVGDYLESKPAGALTIEGEGSLTQDGRYWQSHDVRSTITTIPFVRGNEFDYNWIIGFLNGNWKYLLFFPLIIIIITAVSNGANLTDGLDGLATGTSAVVVFTLLILAYISGNILFSDYLNVMYIPDSSELVIFSAAFVGACVGFLWYNAFPASVFMGDTGSLAIGGIIATLALVLRKELLIPLLCGVFLAETLSVMIQVTWFKYTKRTTGVGRRIFLMSPLHHHYQKKGIPEAKIVTRFWIVAIVLAVITIITLKVR